MIKSVKLFQISNLQELINDVEKWKKVENHPCLCKVIELWISEGTLFIVNQKAKGQELADIYKTMPENMLARVAQRVINGLMHML